MTKRSSTAKVEIYNLVERGRAIGTGWLVARYVDDCRANTLKQFGRDETSARAYAELWNGPDGE